MKKILKVVCSVALALSLVSCVKPIEASEGRYMSEINAQNLLAMHVNEVCRVEDPFFDPMADQRDMVYVKRADLGWFIRIGSSSSDDVEIVFISNEDVHNY